MANLILLAGTGAASPEQAAAAGVSFEVSYPADAASAVDEYGRRFDTLPLDGRVYLLLSTLATPKPRFQVRSHGL